MKGDTLKEKALGGIAWTALNSWGTQLIQFATTLVLAHLLTPADFGVVAMANTVTLLANTLNEFGISSSLVQRKEVEERHLSSAFWANLSVGFILTAVVWLSSGVVARFYGNVQVAEVLSMLSLVFMISSTKVVHGALLTRRLEFGKLAVASIAEMAVNSFVALTTACFLDQGLWSLVYGRLAGVATGSVSVMLASGWRPQRIFHYGSFKELFSFGIYAMGVNFVTYFVMNLDNIVVGRYCGVASLGIYSMAYNIITMPQKKISSVVSGVAFPVFSKLQHDKELVAHAYTKILMILSFLVFPMLAGLAAIAPEFIKLFLGLKWLNVVLPLQILCLAGMLRSIGTTVGSIFFSQGRPDIELKLDIASLFALFIALRVGVEFGVTGIAISVTCHYLVMQLIYFSYVGRLIGRTLWQLYCHILRNLCCSLLMYGVIILTRTVLVSFSANVIVVFSLSILMGVMSYVGISMLLNRGLLRDLFDGFRLKNIRNVLLKKQAVVS